MVTTLHAEFVDRPLPVLDELLKASVAAGQTRGHTGIRPDARHR
jgi:hypothetical protein